MTHPPSTTPVPESALVYASVLEPLFTTLRHSSWEGVPYSWLVPGHGHSLALGFRPAPAVPFVMMAGFKDPGAPRRTRLEEDAWRALFTWSAWAFEVAQTLGHTSTPVDWLILSTYPGRSEHLPPAWVKAARELGTTWGQWQAICQAADRGWIPLTSNTIRIGMIKLLAKESLQPPAPPALVLPKGSGLAQGQNEPKVDGRGRPAQIDLPASWSHALNAHENLSARSRATYRSLLRKILITAGTDDPKACAKAAVTLGTPYCAAWRRVAPREGVLSAPSRLPRAGRNKTADRLEARFVLDREDQEF